MRRGNRITAMTIPGATALTIARRILGDVNNLRVLSSEFSNETAGTFVVAATHIHERYWLLPVIKGDSRYNSRIRTLQVGCCCAAVPIVTCC
jgi:DNA-binding transcriptional LysR family regulator